MPIFEYRCGECQHQFDSLQKLGAAPLTDCPECNASALKKLISAPAFHLKGKGWRNSDDSPKKPDIRPRFAHTLDSATPHAEHTHDAPKPAVEKRGGIDKVVRDHVHSSDHSHSHSHDHGKSHSSEKSAKSHSHDKGHSHDH
jgi:putative FmdB family regulatory protein